MRGGGDGWGHETPRGETPSGPLNDHGGMSHGPDPVTPTGMGASGITPVPGHGVATSGPDVPGSSLVRWLGVVIILILTAAVMSAMSFAIQPTPARVAPPVDTSPPALLLAPASDSGPRGFVPKEVRIPGIGVKAKVLKMGTDSDGAMELPDDPTILGWWRGSSRVGAARGNVVIAGHVYQRDHGYGALWSLRSVEPGDRIQLLGTKGRQVKYEVTKVEATKKVDLDPTTIFDDSGRHQLVLVTCGAYNRETDHYEDNVIVYASPR